MRNYSVHTNKSLEDMRSDASENRKIILEVAKKLFQTQGPDLSMSAIAKEAKVSRATLYRNFQDKQDLVMAIVHYNLDDLEVYAEEIKEEEDSFFLLLQEAAKQQAQFQGLIPYLPEQRDDLDARIIAMFSEPVKKAMEKGRIAQDFDILTDTVILITMLGNIFLYSFLEKEIGFVERTLEILRKGIR